jgi:hypothetical protein
LTAAVLPTMEELRPWQRAHVKGAWSFNCLYELRIGYEYTNRKQHQSSYIRKD